MTKKLINGKLAAKLLKRAVNEKGEDYVDPRAVTATCKYFTKSGKPSCLIGHVLYYADVQLFSGRSRYNENASVTELSEVFPNLFTEKAVDILGVAQTEQDRRVTWGAAYRTALSHIDPWGQPRYHA